MSGSTFGVTHSAQDTITDPFLGIPYYNTRSTTENPQRMINWFMEKGIQGSSKEPYTMFPTPGLVEWADTLEDVVREMIEYNGILYIVAGFKFYLTIIGGTPTLKGTLNPVQTVFVPSMVSNGLQIGIVDNGFGYAYNIAADTFIEITNSYFSAAAPNYMTFQDGYGIYNQPGTSTWWITAINDFSMTSALDFAAADTTNEPITAIISNRQQLYIFTSVGFEVWYNSGANDFPFARKNTSYSTQGTISPGSVTLIDNTIYFLTRSEQGEGFVVQVTGDASPSVVSTRGITTLINDYSTISDAIGFSYAQDGHLFYVLVFPTADKTLVYDLVEQLWHERCTTWLNDPGGGYRHGRWRANCFAFLGSRRLVGDCASGKIYEIDSDVYTDAGERMYREFISPVLWNNLNRINVRSITLDCQVGAGSNTIESPEINFYVSRDGGYNYGNAHVRSLGDVGQYKTRVKINRLGMARAFVGKITTTADADITILGARLDTEASDS